MVLAVSLVFNAFLFLLAQEAGAFFPANPVELVRGVSVYVVTLFLLFAFLFDEKKPQPIKP